jgi:hypothetical protein
MTLLLILTSWLLILVLVVGLCLAARQGDLRLAEGLLPGERDERLEPLVLDQTREPTVWEEARVIRAA